MTYDAAKLARMEAELEGQHAALRGLAASAREDDLDVQLHTSDVLRSNKTLANLSAADLLKMPAEYLKAHGVDMRTVHAAAAAQARAMALRAQAGTLQDATASLSKLVVACRNWVETT